MFKIERYEKSPIMGPRPELRWRTNEYTDMVASGIIDPTKVTRTALENAGSVAGVFLTTESVVADIKEENAPQMPAGGMGGMY